MELYDIVACIASCVMVHWKILYMWMNSVVYLLWSHVDKFFGLPNGNLTSVEDSGWCYLLQLTTEEAFKFCRYDWMRDALENFLTTLAEERAIRRKEESKELTNIRAVPDAVHEEHQMSSPGCFGKPSSVQQLENSCKCIVQAWWLESIFVVKQLFNL